MSDAINPDRITCVYCGRIAWRFLAHIGDGDQWMCHPCWRIRQPEPDWDRWHELLEIRERRAFTAAEAQEWADYVQIVNVMDAKAAADTGLNKLVAEHERVHESIRNLTAAVRKAAADERKE